MEEIEGFDDVDEFVEVIWVEETGAVGVVLVVVVIETVYWLKAIRKA